jgi:hypothetical protein
VLILLSLICLPIGLVKPSLFRFLQRGKPTRLKTSLTLLGILILSFILFDVTYPSSKTKSGATAVVAPTVIPSRPSPSHTPDDAGIQRIKNAMDNPDSGKLDDKVTFNQDYLFITNNDNTKATWTDCKVTVNPGGSDDFTGNLGTIAAGQTVSIAWVNITKSDGTRFDYYQTAPQAETLECTVNGSTLVGLTVQ